MGNRAEQANHSVSRCPRQSPGQHASKSPCSGNNEHFLRLNYPRHLAGRLFAIVVHGDAEGAENVRRGLPDWLSSMELQAAGHRSELDRYISYWKPTATSHDNLDADTALQDKVWLVACTLIEAVVAKRSGKFVTVTPDAPDTRQN